MEQFVVRQTYFAPENEYNTNYFTMDYSSVHGNGTLKVYCSKRDDYHKAQPEVVVDGTLKYCSIEIGDGAVKVSKAVPMVYTFKDDNGAFICGGYLKGDDFLACFGETPNDLKLINPPRNYTIKGSSVQELSWASTDKGTVIYVNASTTSLNITIIVAGSRHSFTVNVNSYESHPIVDSSVMTTESDISKQITKINDRLTLIECTTQCPDISDILSMDIRKEFLPRTQKRMNPDFKREEFVKTESEFTPPRDPTNNGEGVWGTSCE